MSKAYEKNDIEPSAKYNVYLESSEINAIDRGVTSSSQVDLKLAKSGTTIEPLSLISRLSFALAGLPYQMLFCAIGVFSNVFLLETAKLPPEKTLYVLFISRIIDAVTDPIYGFLVNKSPVTRFGKMKPWIVISYPLSAIIYILMWYVPASFSENQLFVWFLFWYSALFTIISGVRIPHTAMTMYVTKSEKERENMTIMRMGFEMIGILLAIIIQGPFATTSNCKKLNESINENVYENLTNSTENVPALGLWESNKYAFIALILGIIFFICLTFLVVFVTERQDLLYSISSSSEQKVNTLKELKNMFTFRPFLMLFMILFLNSLAVQIIQSNLQLYFDYSYTAIKDLFVYAIVGLLGFAILAVPFWKYLMQKIGKKKTLLIGNACILPLLIGCIFLNSNAIGEIITFFIIALVGANCFTTTFLVPWAMLPECVDEYFLKFKNKSDALIYTFLVVGTKVFMAIYLGILQLILDLVDYKNGICAEDQNKNVGIAIKYLFTILPLVCILLGSIFAYLYPIDEERAKENSIKLKEYHLKSESQASL